MTFTPTREERSVALAREAFMRPTAEKLVDQYHRGLVTLGELAVALLALENGTPDSLPQWRFSLQGCCRGCETGSRCEVATVTGDVPALTGDPIVDLVLVHAQGTFPTNRPLEGDDSATRTWSVKPQREPWPTGA